MAVVFACSFLLAKPTAGTPIVTDELFQYAHFRNVISFLLNGKIKQNI